MTDLIPNVMTFFQSVELFELFLGKLRFGAVTDNFEMNLQD